MKLKSLLLGSAFAVLPVALVGASDITQPEEPAVDTVSYVRVCDAYGDKFFYIPGTSSCLKIGGAFRVQAFASNEGKKLSSEGSIGGSDNDLSFQSRAYLNFDVRTDTEYGLLRSYVSLKAQASSGSDREHVALIDAKGAKITDLKPIKAESVGAKVALSGAFLQFGGLTAGYTGSFFTLNSGFDYFGGYSSDETTNLIGYEFDAGGLSLALALEDPSLRRTGLRPQEGDPLYKVGYTSFRLPEVVARVGYDSAVFGLHLSGAWHPIEYGYTLKASKKKVTSKRAFGYAVQLGGELKLNEAKTKLAIGAAYARGATSYLGFGSQEHYTVEIGDGVITDQGKFRANTGWSSIATLKHGFSAKLRADLTASYARLKLAPGSTFKAARFLRVSGDLRYYPIKNLQVGFGLAYDNITAKYFAASKKDKKLNIFSALIRLQRDF